jgi:hypothetical protein
MIKGGYYIKARIIEDSEIAHAAPCIRETWEYILRRANFIDSRGFKRGMLMLSLKQIQEDLSWKVGFRKETYSKDQCEAAMKWLRTRSMITTTKTTRGMIVTVCNYDYYQSPESYEGYMNPTLKPQRSQQTSDTIDKKENNDKNKDNTLFAVPAVASVINIPFEDFWNAYDKKNGSDKCRKKWEALTDKDRAAIMAYLPNYKVSTPDKKFRKNPETFLNNRSWNDEIFSQQPQKPAEFWGILQPGMVT